ncbi:MAG: hypothetical protein HRT72_04745 [Flavobacteriales bacterium]|nr:hypothetical protein [Flavobacteriales bacterium]
MQTYIRKHTSGVIKNNVKILKVILPLFIVLILGLESCDNEIREKAFQSNTAARVNESFLYQEDLAKIIPNNTSHEDSIRMVEAYIEDWVRGMLYYYHAVENLREDQIDIDAEIQKYRNSLISYIYERELVLQKLDTVVSGEDIKLFYESNIDNFKIKTELIKVNYIKMNKGDVDIKEFRKLVRKRNSGSSKSLKKFCNQNLVIFNLEREHWMEIEELEARLGVKIVKFMWALGHNRLVEATKDEVILYVDLKEIRNKDSVAPLSAVRGQVRAIIINQRRLQLINEMENKVYLDAKAQNKFEIF